MKKLQKMVVKLGTSSLTKGKNLSRRHILEYVQQIARLHDADMRIVIVTSGAVAAGREVLQDVKPDRSLPSKQMFAAIGQGRLMQVWAEMFAIFGISVGQVLLTREDLSDRQRYLNVRDTLFSLLDHRVIPIINENDAVANEEIKVGDNDTLSAMVANLIAADLLILLTDQKGLYTADPRRDQEAKLIPLVDHIDDSIRALASGTSKGLGFGAGGMITKVEAAHLATQGGTPTLIASAAEPDVLAEIVSGKSVGTLFSAVTTPLESRKRWLLSKKTQGMLYIDVGAERKLCKEGASLLPVGITKTSQPFARGAIIKILSTEDHPLAVGLTSYSSAEIEKLIGIKSSQIESVLGYSYGPEVVHRDNMIILKGK
jgi:glutamate 5-kinase